MTVKDETCLADDSSSNDVSTIDPLNNKQHLSQSSAKSFRRMESVLHNPNHKTKGDNMMKGKLWGLDTYLRITKLRIETDAINVCFGEGNYWQIISWYHHHEMIIFQFRFSWTNSPFGNKQNWFDQIISSCWISFSYVLN